MRLYDRCTSTLRLRLCPLIKTELLDRSSRHVANFKWEKRRLTQESSKLNGVLAGKIANRLVEQEELALEENPQARRRPITG